MKIVHSSGKELKLNPYTVLKWNVAIRFLMSMESSRFR